MSLSTLSTSTNDSQLEIMGAEFKVTLAQSVNILDKSQHGSTSMIPLFKFINEINQPDADCEAIADNYLEIYGRGC